MKPPFMTPPITDDHPSRMILEGLGAERLVRRSECRRGVLSRSDCTAHSTLKQADRPRCPRCTVIFFCAMHLMFYFYRARECRQCRQCCQHRPE
ncbi:hypothetical protein BDV09DRAFT_45052 [Aspergillus tetrazonus]